MAVVEHLLVLESARQHSVSLEEAVGRWRGQDEAKLRKNLLLHFEHLVLGELVLADGQKFAQLWRINFFILGCNQQCRHSKQVELALLNLDLRQVLINDELGDVKALGLQAEFSVHVDDPLEQESARRVSNFRLYLGNVGRVDHKFSLLFLQVLENRLAELGQMLRISEVLLVLVRHFLHLRLDVFGDSFAELLRDAVGVSALIIDGFVHR